MTNRNPIPDSIRAVVAIGTYLPPFAIGILAYLWVQLNSPTAVILPIMGWSTFTLLPLLLNIYICWKFKGAELIGQGKTVAGIFWLIAVIPLAGTMSTLTEIKLEMALALPVVLIAGFYCSAVLYLVSAIVCAKFIRKPTTPALD